VAQIKDLVAGARAAAAIATNEEWKAARPAQIAVSENDLVEEVKKALVAQDD
jgi:histidyl-tRNA synthetase